MDNWSPLCCDDGDRDWCSSSQGLQYIAILYRFEWINKLVFIIKAYFWESDQLTRGEHGDEQTENVVETGQNVVEDEHGQRMSDEDLWI